MMARISKLVAFLVALLVICLATGCSSKPIALPLTPGPNIQLPADNHKPSIDLLTLDARVQLLYVSHASTASLDVVDVRAKKVVGSVTGLIDIKATALTPDSTIVFTSDGGEGMVAVVDVNALKVLTRIDVSGSPDDIAYDAAQDLIAVSVPSRQRIVLINRTTRKVVGGIDLPGKSELMAVDGTRGRLFVAINDKDEVVTIDLATQTIASTYKGCDLKAPTGVAYDADQGRLFVGDSGAEVSIIDVLLDKCLGGIDIGHGADQIAFNSHLHHLYTANSASQNVSVIDTVSLKPLGVVGTGPGAATVAADPTSDLVYVVVARAGIVATYHDP